MAKLTGGTHELQERYSALVDAKLRKTLVTKDEVIFNNRYEGSPVSGSVKIPVRDGEVAVKDYNVINGIDTTQSATAYLTVTMKDQACSELIDGFEAAAVPDGLVADRLDSAGYSMGLQLDNDALKTLVYAAEGKDEAGVAFAATDVRYGKQGTVTAATPTKANIFESIVAMGVALDKANVPAEGRWLILSPETYAMALTSDDFIKKGDMSQELVMQGAVGEVAGFTVFKSNNIPATSASKVVYAIAGHPDFCARVEEWAVEPQIKDFNDGKHIGASYLAGRKVYRHAVTKPQTLAMITAE